ncbi:beta-lactamase/transpeptidase-like protein [Myriangium duriaei CBS 260.36]|uniref:Beta-lactamase/transpeptidase-like protein n=1 Tax=Myriangium duriaei CBS 260.36 TaxID=1168546 RepID=A0A9P4J8P3_9PEZI|nr:beta-lactamase/transpeptidase-like protein [Myriangium duriaei CBS 260.36]
MAFSSQSLKQAVADVPARYKCPGGAVAVLKDGKVVETHTWGFADLEEKAPMTPGTLLPICSISKQMLCATILGRAQSEPDFLDRMQKELEALLPDMTKNGNLTVHHLWNMQSGIRDYWALTVLWGAKVGQKFSIKGDGPQAMARLGKLHFEPGSEYSYSNVNFYILERCLEKVSGSTFQQLSKEHLFQPAGMHTAAVRPDTAKFPSPIVGYEGTPELGFYPAPNAIEWSGDAGIVASLNDMIAYEQWLERNYADSSSVYRAMIKPQEFSNGKPAPYGHGLARTDADGVVAYRHGGALRGFDLQRLHVPQQNLSVVVLRNMTGKDSSAAADYIVSKALSVEETSRPVVEAASGWNNTFLDDDTHLKIEISLGEPGKLKLVYAGIYPETITLTSPTEAESPGTVARLVGEKLIVDRVHENRRLSATLIPTCTSGVAEKGLSGVYHCQDVDSTLRITGENGMLYGSFEGFLGHGSAHLLRHIGESVWAIYCPRALDASPPGDWTLVLRRDSTGVVKELIVGCWLARNLEYKRQ